MQWNGTLLQCLEVVKSDPMMTKLSDARIYDMFISSGSKSIQDTDDPRTKRLYKDELVKSTSSLPMSSSASSAPLRRSSGAIANRPRKVP
jgi:predicted Ser/Thr protein kinase